MAGSGGVWGIDIGQCGLKALRCTLADDGKTLVAGAFDFIEYPKILSQPDANPEELVRDALKQFLSRNPVRGCKVAISVSGQSGLARFIKLPPVESKKIPDIVKYEARQQIPFSLEDVVWDYQQMPGGSEEDGFALETEVGLFAMKRDQVFRAIRPLVDAEVEIDIIQLTPLCIYNAVAFDVLGEIDAQDFDSENPPESAVVLSMGTDTSDLVVTNGFRVWQRSIPLGGNHYTKQLMKDMKLTFAKAEHLKRNARDAEDPKAVFQSMRPIFGDLVTEVQRSIGYFQNIDRGANIGRVIILGNAAKLPGLPQYLGKNLGLDVVSVSGFERLDGGSVTSSPAFKDNVLSFGVCYGLCLQGLGGAKLSTNLVPREIITQRLIRRKKPWAVAVVGIMLLACTFHFFFNWQAWRDVDLALETGGRTWEDAHDAADRLVSTSNGLINTDTELVEALQKLNSLGEEAVAASDGRLLWLELFKAINQALPRDPSLKPGEFKSVEDRPLPTREELYIDHIECEYFEDLSEWFNDAVKAKYRITLEEKARRDKALKSRGVAGQADATATTDGADSADGNADADSADSADDASAEDDSGISVADLSLSGPGWVIQLKLHHYHNTTPPSDTQYVHQRFLANMVDGTVSLPVVGPDGTPQTEQFTYEDLGIRFPIIAEDGVTERERIRDPNLAPANDPTAGLGGFAGGLGNRTTSDADDEGTINVLVRKDCIVQFCWQEQRASVRAEKRRQEQLQEAGGLDPDE